MPLPLVAQGALGEHEYRKHEGSHQQGSSGYDQTSGSGLTGSNQGQGQHHYGRDAAALGGAGALGEHEYRKHEGSHQTGSNLGSSNQYDNTPSTQHQSGHHLGRDAAVAGAGEHEYRKHHSGTNEPTSSDYSQQSGTTGSSNYGQSNTGSNKITDPSNDGRIGPNVVEGSDGRNRLHKDPPAGHPASGLVSGSGSGSGYGDKGSNVGSGNETQRMMQEGKERMDDDTGVAHSRKETSNY